MTVDVKVLLPERKDTTLILSHRADLDGVASAIILRHILECKGENPVVLFADYGDADQIMTEESPGRKAVWMSDISIKTNALALGPLLEYDQTNLFVFDHHASSRTVLKGWERRGKATVVFNDSGQFCTADLAHQFGVKHLTELDLINNLSQYADLVNATHSIDLWLRTDKRGDCVSDVIAVLGAQRVFDLLWEDVGRINLESFTEEMLQAFTTCEIKRKESMALAQNTAYCSVYADIANPDYTGALQIITAVCKGFESQVGEMMYLWSVTPKIIVLMNPDEQSLSFRIAEHSIVTTNVRANRVAAQFGGGGHPMASGAPMPEDLKPLDTLDLANRVKEAIEKLYLQPGFAIKD